MDRRSFIKLTAVTGSTAALAACGDPDVPLIRFVPDEDIVPGIAVWKPSVCPLCPSGCGLTVRVMDADAEVMRDGQSGLKRIYAAKKLEGSAAHPVNQGGLCARGQAAIQVTYHPDRITQPLKRSGDRGTGQYAAVSWDDAIAQFVGELDKLAAAGNQQALAYIGRHGGGHRAMVAEQFLTRFGAPAPVVYELFGDEVLRRANAMSFGRAQLPTFDLANARHVVSFGADFLGTWNSPVAQSAGYGAMRQGRPGVRGSFVQVEARMSQTGANADEWVPVAPGREGLLAVALANVIVRDKLRPESAAGRAGAALSGWPGGNAEFSLDRAEEMTGVALARIERLARELVERSPSVAIVGGPALAHTNGLQTALAVNALNALLGSVGQPGGLSFTPRTATFSAGATRPLSALVDAPPQLVIVDGANPVYASPKAWNVRELLEKAPFIVSVGSFLDETSVLADLILPDHSFLESWTSAAPESGAAAAVVSVAGPVMMPLYDTRATVDVLLDVGRRLQTPVELPWQNAEEMLTATVGALPPPNADVDTWSDALEKGMWTGQAPAAPASDTPAAPAAAPAGGATATFDGDPQQFPLHFLPYASSTLLDGSVAHLPWLQEMPDPLTSAMWSSWVEINPATAQRLGIRQGDVVEITSSQGSLRSAAVLTPGIAPDVVAMPMGQGHTQFTRYATGRGENPVDLLAPVTEPATGTVAWAATRVRVARAGDPDGRLILFAGGDREHGEAHR